MNKLPDDIKQLDDRIKKFQKRTKAVSSAPKSQMRVAMEAMFRLATEFAAPVLIALCIGYLTDKLWNTKPVFMIILALFGCAAGVLNLYKAAQQVDKDLNKE